MIGCVSLESISTVAAAAFKEKVVWSFGSGTDGQYPSDLIDVKGMLYGTTLGGGANGGGTVFAVDRKSGTENVVYAFCSQNNCVDGASPSGRLIDVNGTLYGTTASGGSGLLGPHGTVFALNPRTGVEIVLYSFCNQQNCSDGSSPLAGLTRVRGVLYGTTQGGGTGLQPLGTAYGLDPVTGAETVLYSFCQEQNCTDGQNPNPGLIDLNGTLYGITAGGGTHSCGNGQGCGTVFSLDRKTGAHKVLHSFGNGTDGKAPEASLIAVNGLLYGTTYGGGLAGCGAFGCGTVFSIDPNTGAEKVLYSFCSQQNCADGANPSASLIDANGILYGTTSAGGGSACNGSGCGTVFSIDPNTGAETVLYSFCSQQNCTDGANPLASLIAVKSKFYGTTRLGGVYGYGTVFALKKKR